MALTLPLHLIDGLSRCCGLIPSTSLSVVQQNRLADFLIADASLFDVIRWRKVSKAFRAAADNRLSNYKIVYVRMYNGIAKLRNFPKEKNCYEWHPRANVMFVEIGTNELGVGIDTMMKIDDVHAIVQVLSAFRHSIQQLYMDSPIIEMIVSHINQQQVNVLLNILREQRTISIKKQTFVEQFFKLISFNNKYATTLVRINNQPDDQMPYGPFFPQLKKLTITSQSNQLEHLSRLLNYSVSVKLLYETSQIDLLCLKICMGKNAQWYQKPHNRMFRHVNKFRQWTEADSLGERYFQQFSGIKIPNYFRH